MDRIKGLDYLRGICAFLIIIYHYTSWSGFNKDVSVISIFGVYGVSIFYILSGLTLYHVYISKFTTNFKYDTKIFFLKRIFRIFPLLWLATIVTFIISFGKFNYYELLINLTGAFGFIAPEKYIAGGAWSIGNELVFYATFPFLILMIHYKKYLFYITYFISFLLIVLFAYHIVDNNNDISKEWDKYINPLNQFFFFISGIFIGLHYDRNNTRQSLILILLTILVIAFIIPNDKIDLISSQARIYFSLVSLAFVVYFYSIRKINIPVLDKVFLWLGEISYSTYLLHPIVWYVSKYVLKMVHISNPWLIIVVSVIFTLVSSHFIYKLYEIRFVRMGNKLIQKKTQ